MEGYAVLIFIIALAAVFLVFFRRRITGWSVVAALSIAAVIAILILILYRSGIISRLDLSYNAIHGVIQ